MGGVVEEGNLGFDGSEGSNGKSTAHDEQKYEAVLSF